MKKLPVLLLSVMMILSCGIVGFTGCNKTNPPDDNPPVDNPNNPNPEQPGEVDNSDTIHTDRDCINYAFDKIYTKGELKDTENGFSSADDVTGARYFVNGQYTNDFKTSTSRQDIKLEFYNANNARLVNVSAGMEFTVPNTELSIDYSIAKYRTQISFDDSVLTVSMNTQNPYTSLAGAWYTYNSEWLIRHLNNDDYLDNQGLERINGTTAYTFTQQNPVGDLDVKPGYDVYRYDIRILDDTGNVERPYYNITIIRATNSVKEFAMFVMKSKADQASVMDTIVQSYSKLSSKGVQKNYFDAGDPQLDDNWNDETKAYYDQLINSEKVHWGVFSRSMPGMLDQLDPSNAYYKKMLSESKEIQKGIETAWDYKYDIYPTYTHIGSGQDASNFSGHYFPLNMARELAGGNGVNGKPVLQFTYQFTLNNNLVAYEVTPMFDIMRGEYDEHFTRLARDIKTYGKPVLFRLNNEMNTDWTSYSGMMTLCDPDIFNITWIRLYEIFEKEGVDNCIWIWNPIATSCPYSSWGEDLCFFPGLKYVHLLGGTNYEMNNKYDNKKSWESNVAEKNIISFKERYSGLYQKNLPVFSKWVIILSEFACGSGGDFSGELGRNRDAQARWVTEMFEAFAAEDMEDWARNIKGAVWFNCNDIEGKKITNRLCIFDAESSRYTYNDLAGTMKAFRDGFASLKK